MKRCLINLIAFGVIDPVFSEVVFDGSIGGYKGNATGSPNYQIPYEPGQKGSLAGSNLFQSFSKFNLATGETATFMGPPNIQNILARVTDGPSNIQGTIRSQINGANLFLMNPAGIVFGDGARLDVKGAFHATTADYIQFEDGSRFLASSSGGVTLLSARPEAFGFLDGGGLEGKIEVTTRPLSFTSKVNLKHPKTKADEQATRESFIPTFSHTGKTLNFVGRQVTLDQTSVSAVGGSIGLVATGLGSHVVGFDPVAGTVLPGGASAYSGKVRILSSQVNVSSQGIDSGGGSIRMHAGEAVVDIGGIVTRDRFSDGAMVEDRRALVANGSGGKPAGMIDLDIVGALDLSNGGSLQANSSRTGDGDAGFINVKADSLHISAGSSTSVLGISSSTSGSGKGGSIHVDIRGFTLIEDRGVIQAQSAGLNSLPGSIDFRSGSLRIVGLKADNDLPNAFLTGIIGLVTPDATGFGANLRVNVPGTILLEQGGLIDTSSLSANISIRAGNAGSIEVTAGTLWIDRMGSEYFTGVGSDTEFKGSSGASAPTWNAGDVSVNANHIELRNGGLISSSTGGTGNAGSVRVTAGSINATGQGADTRYVYATGSGIVAATRSNTSGNGGNLTITSSGALTVQQGGLLGAQALGEGTGGSVTIQAGSTRLYDGGSISSNTAGAGRAGGVTLSTGDLIVQDSEIGVRAAQADAGKLEVISSGDIRLTGGLITADAGGVGNAGNVSVHGRNIMITGRGSGKTAGIVASTGVNSSGQGGNVDVLASGDLTLQQGARIAAESLGLGTGGSLQIQAANLLVNDSEIGVLAKNANAGTLVVDVSGDITMRGGLVTASAGQTGGDIVIGAGGIIYIAQSLVTADAQGNGGNITFDRARHLVLNGTTVSASAVDANGGNIFISTGTFFANESILSVTSARGAPGTVTIETIDSLSGGEETQEVELLNPDDVLQPDCTKRAASTASSFIQAGRGGTRRLPGGYLPSFRIFQ